jgi:hypothetical protein
MIDDIAVEFCLAGRFEDADLARRAFGAERPWRKIDMVAGIAALQPQLAVSRAIPEMLGFRRRFWFRARGLGHVGNSLPKSLRS